MPHHGKIVDVSKNYSRRLLGFSVWVFFLLMALSWVLVGFYTWEKVRAQEIANLRILSVALAHSTSQSVFNVQSSLDLLADSLRNMSAGRDLNLSHRLKNYLQAQPAIQNITVMDDKGRVLSEAFRKDYPGTNSLAMQNVHYFFLKSDFYIGSLFPDIQKRLWYIPFKRLVQLKNHQEVTVVVLLPLVDGTFKCWMGYPLQAHTGLFLLRRDGYLEARDPPPDKTSFTIRQTGIAARYVAAHTHSAGGVYMGYSTAVGQWRLGAVEDVPNYPLVAGASILRSTLWDMWARSMIGPSLVIAFLALLGLLVYRYLRYYTELQEKLRSDAEMAIWEAKERAEVTLSSIGDAVITTDTQARVTGANSVAENLLGKKISDIRGEPLDNVFKIINETTRETVANPVHRVLDEGRIMGLANHTTLISADGHEYAIEDSAAPIRFRTGQILGVVLVFHDVSQRRQLADQLAHQAGHDALTQLPNRRLFQQHLEAACQVGQGVNSFFVAILDLDGFKQINDLFGHDSGDVLLCALAKRMELIFGKQNIIARLGGDEFGLILYKPQKIKEIDVLLTQALGKISEPVEVLGSLVTVSATIGISSFPSDADDPGQLLRLADLAMYAAKTAGRNGYVFYNEALEAKQQLIAEGIHMAEQALAENRFVLWYQPLVALHGHVLGVEALLRLDTGRGEGLLNPSHFSSALDHPLLARKIGRFVLDAAVHQGMFWRKQGFFLRVGINISARHLLDSDFMQDIHAILARYPDFPRDLIELEVTESAPMLDFPSAITTLQAINALGIHIALDDFGTGNASLTYLQRLPAQTIKIDQSFVRDILVDNKDLAIVAGVASTAQALGLEIVAEGVESLGHARKLADLGVNVLQGFAIAQPMPAEDILNWVAHYKPILRED
jgi:diguanylate cyclase (GGDEF)-like protein/PAS domain S-box-containing protein